MRLCLCLFTHCGRFVGQGRVSIEARIIGWERKKSTPESPNLRDRDQREIAFALLFSSVQLLMELIVTKQIIWFCIAGFGVLAVLFFWGRKGPNRPSQLRVTPPEEPKATLPEDPLGGGSGPFVNKALNSSVGPELLTSSGVMFSYKGKNWNAYQVLGVQPNSSAIEVKAAFDKAMKLSGSNSSEFLKMALTTVLNDMKTRGYHP